VELAAGFELRNHFVRNKFRLLMPPLSPSRNSHLDLIRGTGNQAQRSGAKREKAHRQKGRWDFCFIKSGRQDGY
jgi:hypothetical protein